MIKNLQIQNYAIIESLNLELDKGLTAITGETGAGKSILLGALGLVLGKRADTKVLYDQDNKCVVEVTFDISDYDLKPFFEEHDLVYDDETIIRRTITPSGKSRAFINDEPTTLSILKLLNVHLLELHQQFDTLEIQKNKYQINTLDAIAGNKQNRKKYTVLYTQLIKLEKTLEDLTSKQAEGLKERDFLQFQLDELVSLSLIEGEQEEKEEALKVLESVEDLQKVSSLISASILENDQNVLDQLQQISSELYTIQKVNKSIASLYERVNSTIEELKDIEQEARYISDVDFDEEKLVTYRDRLDSIYRLQKKHSVKSLKELLDTQLEIEEKLSGYSDISESIVEVQNQITDIQNKLKALGQTISDNRSSVIPNFEKNLKELLASLSMPNAVLSVRLAKGEEILSTGLDEINFLFSSNKGSQPQEIKDVASGGEISRLALCIKSLVADAMTMPTLIFDEIDSGVSGDVATKMGDILKVLAKNHQLITITHSPQIAAKADEHYFVYKQDTEDRTISDITKLDEKRRVVEIAKMLSRNPPPGSALENARELLNLS